MNKKYNPEFHNSIVDNVRAIARQHGLDTTKLTNEQVYTIHCDCYFCEDVETEMIETLKELCK